MSSLLTPQVASPFVPREPRFEVHHETEVTIGRRYDREPRELTGVLIDLTALGAKLSTSIPLSIEEFITLHFRFGEHGLNFMVDAQVRWTRPAEESRWWMGCSFTPKLPEEYLVGLARKGLLDRRREERRKVSLAATARWELAEHERHDVHLEDISSGGVRLSAPRGAEPGQRVLIDTVGAGGKALVIPVRCQWQVENAGRFSLGCSFIDASGFAQLSEALIASDSLAAAQPMSKQRLWMWPWR